MKAKIFILLLLCSLSAHMTAQRYTVSDTTYISSTGGAYFTVRDVVYSNGEESHVKTIIGDSAALFLSSYDRFVTLARQMATDARAVMPFPRQIGELNKQNNYLLSVSGRDIMDSITAKLSGPLLEDGWTVKSSGVEQDITFNINNNGQLRYTVAGTTKNALFFGDVIRLNAYLGGNDLDFFKVESGNYKTIDNASTLRRPGGHKTGGANINKVAAPVILNTQNTEKKPAVIKKTKKKPTTKSGGH